MKQRVTIHDVARRAEVSPATVSNLLNGKGRLGDETRRRITAAMDELHYAPSGLLRALHSRRANVLGLMVGGFRAELTSDRDSITLPLLAGVYTAAEDALQDVLLFTGWPERPERSSGVGFLDGRADGLIWVTPPAQSAALEKLASARFPVVAALSRRVPDGVGYVDAENVRGARLMTEHLLSLGHTRVAYVGPDDTSNFSDRRQGYRDAMEQLGPGYDPDLVTWEPTMRRHPVDADAYDRAFSRLIALPDPPTAVFVCTDRWARHVADAAARRGVRIPGDLALAGFDDSPYAADLCGGLTTIRQPFAEIGMLAVERLLRLIGGASPDECRVTVPVSLIVRASTGGPQMANDRAAAAPAPSSDGFSSSAAGPPEGPSLSTFRESAAPADRR